MVAVRLRTLKCLLIAVSGVVWLQIAQAAPAPPPPARPDAFQTAIGLWRTLAESGKMLPEAFKSFGWAMGQQDAKRGPAVSQVVTRCRQAKEYVCSGLGALVIRDETALLEAWKQLAVPANKGHVWRLTRALVGNTLAEAAQESNPGRSLAIWPWVSQVLNEKSWPADAAWIQASWAMVLWRRDNGGTAADPHYQKATAIFQKLGQLPPGRFLEMAGRVRIAKNLLPQANELLKRAQASYTREKDTVGQLRTMAVMGSVLAKMGKAEDGLAMIEKAFTLYKQTPGAPPAALADLFVRRAGVYEGQNRIALSAKEWGQAGSAFLKAGMKDEANQSIMMQAEMLYKAGMYTASAEAFGALLKVASKAASSFVVRIHYAQSLAEIGRCKEATPQLDKAMVLQKTDKNVDLDSILTMRLVKARCMRLAGKDKEAIKDFGEVINLATTFKNTKIMELGSRYAKGLKLPPPTSSITPPIPANILSGSQALSGSVPLSGSPVLSASTFISPSQILSPSVVVPPAAPVTPSQPLSP